MDLTKIKFNVKQTSELEASILIDRILAEIKPFEYKIIQKTDHFIKFNDKADFSNNFKLYSQFQKAKRMYKGQFEVLNLNDNRLVTLTYYRSITFEVLLFVFLIIVALTAKQPLILLIELPFITQFLIFANLSKEDNQQMLDRVTNDIKKL